MTSEQEAQQAQVIDTITRAHRIAKLKLNSQGVEPIGIAAHLDRGVLLKIVDSQAQKMAEQAKRIEILEKCYYAAMNRFAFDSEENRDSWYAAQNNKREFDKDLK